MDNKSASQDSQNQQPNPEPVANPNPQPNIGTPPQPPNTVKVGEHTLTDGEFVMFAEINNSFMRLRALTAKFLCEKYGYNELEPYFFEFDWKNKIVTAYKQSTVEVANNAPPTPTQEQTP